MRNVRRTAAAILALCAAGALGEPARALAAGEGIRVGPALLFPSLGITETYDDNVALTSANPQEDWETTVAPALRLVLPVRRFFVAAEAGVSLVSYREHSQEDSTDWSVGAAVGADFPGGLGFRVGDTHADRYLKSSQEFGPGEDSAENTLRATVAYTTEARLLRLEGSWLRTEYWFGTSADRERVESSLQADVYWKFRPQLSAFVEAAFADYAYDSNAAQDSSTRAFGLGLTWDFTSRSSGIAKAGYQWKSYAEENSALGIEDAGYYTLSASLHHVFTRRTTLEAELSRSSEESDFADNPYYLRTALDASLSHRFTTKLYGRASLRVDVDDYPHETTYDNPYDPADAPQAGTRSDTTVEGKLTAGFDATRWLWFELAYGVERRDSSFGTFDYTDTRVSLSAKAAF